MSPVIAVLPGDGIGPEVIREGLKVLKAIEKAFGHRFEIREAPIGGCAYDEFGDPLPEGTMEVCRGSDAILMGAVGGPKWDQLGLDKRPEQALLRIRKEFGCFANLRPIIVYPALAGVSPLKSERIRQGINILLVRELTGGLYYGKPKERTSLGNGFRAVDTMEYTTAEIERIARVAFETARKRRKKVTSIDKANILETSRLWRETVERVGKGYPDVALDHVLVDVGAMKLVTQPQDFDVIVTENTFGDILSDEGAVLAGSLGMLPSGSISTGRIAYYEPVHGSAPDIAGQRKANPLGSILTVAMMLTYSFNLLQEAGAIERAVEWVLNQDYRTVDIMEPGKKLVATDEMGDLVADRIGRER
ncbi:MAG: 3-isopropylmalate dehydrogenase [Candidatus Tectomicrobia bacterium]|uniref:3-isopropylmalate dehydrogenase n=1 Tax=Tectimicrobiota bacterium TaxID=2528274 RepID=A0A932GQK1_UNCTE|nr:3-isopropylmalate dehydrogenase [Candidatus Tectomicrobia bacterium]